MPYDYEEEQRRRKELEQRRAAVQREDAQAKAAAAAAPSQKPSTPREAAKAAKPEQRPEGLISQAGQALNYLYNNASNDALNAVAAGINRITPDNLGPLKGLTQSLDDNIRSSQELDQLTQQRAEQVKTEGSLLDKATFGAATNLQAVEQGMQAGVALPVTFAASVAGQDAPWARSPEIVKDHPISDTIFKIAEVLTPTVLTMGVGGPAAAGTTGLATESFTETIAQDNIDELIAGRELAVKVGEVANFLGMDGTQLTQEMVEGKTLTGKTLSGVVGFLQNFGINVTADQIVKRVAPIAAEKFSPLYERVARVFGSDSTSVRNAVNDVNAPKYTDLDEPHNVVDIDSSVPVAKAQPDPIDVDAAVQQWRDINLQIDEAIANEDPVLQRTLEAQLRNVKENVPMSAMMAETDAIKQELILDGTVTFQFTKESPGSPMYSQALDALQTSIWDVSWDAQKLGRNAKSIVTYFNKWVSTMEPGTVLSNAPLEDSVRGSTAANRRVASASAKAQQRLLTQAREDWIKQNSDQFPYVPADGSQGFATAADYWDNFLSPENQLENAQRIAEVSDGYDWYWKPTEDTKPSVRAQLYKRVGFGDVDPFHGNQFAVVRANPDSKGRYLSPLNLDLKNTPESIQALSDAVTAARNAPPSPTQAKSVSPTALTAEALRPNAIASDDTIAAGRHYFTNWKAVVDEEGLQTVLQEATSTLKRLRDFPTDVRESIDRVMDWWRHNRDVFDTDINVIAESFKKNFTKPINGSSLPDDLKTALTEYAQVDNEGFLAASLIGEELGIRIQKQARDVQNLENVNIDFYKAVENLLDLHDTANLFMIPLRRAKRRWAVEGTMQQRKTLKTLKDADIRNALSAPFPASYTAPSSELTKVKWTDTDPGMTLREIWESAKGGDEDALTLFKQYINHIAYSDPRESLSNVMALGTALKEARRKDLQEAIASIYYAFRLSRPRTQIASMVSNIVNLVGEPIGAAWSGERAYALGQFIGGWTHLSASMADMGRAFKANKPLLDNNVRYGDNILSHVERAAQIEDAHRQAVEAMNLAKAPAAEKFGELITYKLEQISNHPLLGIPQRLLIAQDDGAKAITAAQVATGRAFQEASQMGLLSDKETLTRLTDRHLNTVFSEGVKHGKIIDPEVNFISRSRTFQNDIPDPNKEGFIDNGLIGNAIDSGFRGLQSAANESAIFRFFSPFTRMSYNALEKGGVFLAGAGQRVGGTAALQNMFPRYKAIMSGELGDAARIQLQSQFAFAELTALTGVAYAALGGLTGVNETNKPKQSFIIPAPGTETGYVAVPYNRVPILAMLLTPIADAVNGFRDEVLTRGDYEKFLTEMVFTMGVTTLDQSFMLGLQQASQILDVKNMDPNRVQALASTLASIPTPSIVPAVASYFAPFYTASKDEGSFTNTFMAKFAQRTIGGVGLPPIYDELTGKPQPRVAALGKTEDYWSHVGASLLNEFLWPGAVLPVDPTDKVKANLQMVGFSVKPEDSYRTYKGVNLDLKEQSALSLAMHTHGNLRGNLDNYFKSNRFKNLWNEFQRLRKLEGGALKGRTRNPEIILERDIHGDIRKIRNKAKEDAIKHLSGQEENLDLFRKFTVVNQLANMDN